MFYNNQLKKSIYATKYIRIIIIYLTEDAMFYNKQLKKSISATKYICRIIIYSFKFDMIYKLFCLTYKSKEGIVKLKDIKGKWLYGQCNTCGFSRVWLSFLWKKVVDSEIGSPDEISDLSERKLVETIDVAAL